MKGQASLEMVVGLIILLVVAGVVIGLVIHFINPRRMPNPEEKLSVNEFLTNCEQYCNDINSVEYCRDYYSGIDWNKNGIKHEILELGKYNWMTCEDRVYCFLVEPCEERFGRGLDVMKKCKRVLCQTYLEKYSGDADMATQALKDDINFPMVCDLSEIPNADNWYEIVFAEGCGAEAPQQFSINSLSNCIIDNNDPSNPTFTCDVEYTGDLSDTKYIIVVPDEQGHPVMANETIGSVRFVGDTLEGDLNYVPDLLDWNENFVEGDLVNGLCAFAFVWGAGDGESIETEECEIVNTP